MPVSAPANSPDFDKQAGLLPAVIQDADSRRVLMLGFMNPEAYEHTLASGQVTFYSRSKERLWTKGESSGNVLDVVALHLDCDQDTLLVKARPRGPVCHTGADTCFFEENASSAAFLDYLEDFLADRKANPKLGSHTSQMFAKGTPKMAQKVGEEAVELVIEAMGSDDERFRNEAADLLYRFLSLLVQREVPLQDVMAVLQERHRGA